MPRYDGASAKLHHAGANAGMVRAKDFGNSGAFVKFTCPKCTTRYTVDDAKVPANRKVRFTCKKCSEIIRLKRSEPTETTGTQPDLGAQSSRSKTIPLDDAAVKSDTDLQGPAKPEPPKEAIQAPSNTQPDIWFALVDGQELGPLSDAQLGLMQQSGEIQARTYMWREGMDAWLRLEELPEFAELSVLSALAAPSKPPTPAETHTRDAIAAASEDTPQSSNAAEAQSDVSREILPPSLQAAATEPSSEQARLDAAARAAAQNPPAGYTDAPAGDDTRAFITTAGIYQRRRHLRLAAGIGAVACATLFLVLALDVMGFITLPGMGLMYDVTGLQDPNMGRATLRIEERLARPNLSAEERLALRNRLLGPADLQPTAEDALDDEADLALGAMGLEDLPLEPPPLDGDGDGDGDAIPQTEEAWDIEPTPELSIPNNTQIQTSGKRVDLSVALIQRVIARSKNPMTACLKSAIDEGETPSERFELEITLLPRGRVGRIKTPNTKNRKTVFARCALEEIRTWRFPKFSGKPVSVTFPYLLSAGD